MAKDDYDFLVFRILTYLYACFQRRCHFETTAFMKRVISQEVSEDYLVDVLRFMTREELIEGLAFVNAWGNDYTLACDYADTLDTVHKLTDTIKNIDKIMMLEDGDYSRTGEWEADMRGSYGRTENYSRGNSYANRGQQPEPARQIEYSTRPQEPQSEFVEAASAVPFSRLMEVLDKHMDSIKLVYQKSTVRLYTGSNPCDSFLYHKHSG